MSKCHKKILFFGRAPPIVHIFHSLIYEIEPSFMKLGSTFVWRDARNGVGSGFEFSKWGMGTRMIYTIPLISCFKVPNQTFTRPEVKRESRKRGLGAEPLKSVALVVCPLKTNADYIEMLCILILIFDNFIKL